MKIAEVISYLEQLVPKSMQETYDNSGLLIGDKSNEVKGVLVCLDCTPEIVQEAISKGCNLIIAHHPIIFKGLKKLSGNGYVEQTVIDCIKNDISLYAAHTNLDNYDQGVNKEIGERLGLLNLKVLRPKSDVLCTLDVFVPEEFAAALSTALFAAGAGKIGNYEECHFYTKGTGTYMPIDGANPTEGTLNVRSTVTEIKMQFLVSIHRLNEVLVAMKANHPYEEVAHNILPLMNENQTEGSGMIGELAQSMDEQEFLIMLKNTFQCACIRHTKKLNKPIRKVAYCGGSGSFLLQDARVKGADIFITGDFKYHEFFDAEEDLMIADIGHYESEQFTVNLLADIIKKKFANFAVHLTGINTNPINYF